MSDRTHLKALLRDNGQGLTQRMRSNIANAIDALERERERFWRANLALQKSRDAAEQERAKEWQRAQGAEERNRKLKARAEAAEARVKRLEDALRFYAEGEWPEDYPGGVLYAAGDDTDDFKTHIDYGDRARAALQEDKSHE